MVGIGLWLTLGGKGLSAALFRLRTAGLKPEPDQTWEEPR